jgi:hypothetical protein
MTTNIGQLAVRAEVMKLARLLDLAEPDLDYLQRLDAPDLRALREQVTGRLFDSHNHALERIAGASRLLPTGVIAVIAEQAFGPMLAALIAGLLDPARAAEVAGKLSTPFLAQAAVHIDPRRTGPLLTRIPPQRIAVVAGALAAAGEHVTLGRFVGHLPDESIRLALDEMDDLTVVRVAFVLEEEDGVERVLGLMQAQRLQRLLDAAVGTELWPDVLELYDGVGEPLRSQVLGSRSADESAA